MQNHLGNTSTKEEAKVRIPRKGGVSLGWGPYCQVQGEGIDVLDGKWEKKGL